MGRRLLASYLALTACVLAVLVVPLGLSYSHNQRQDLTAKVERDAVVLTTFAEDLLGGLPGVSRTSLQGVVTEYEREAGARVVIVDRSGLSVVDSSDPDGPSRSFASRPELARALATGEVVHGVRRSNTLGADLLYVAVPVASSGSVYGAVRVTYPLEAVQDRVRRYWLILASVAAVVLAAVAVVGLRIAFSIARPLAALERAAAAVGAGDLAVRAPAQEGPPEVRALAASFNDTVHKLDELIRSREAFVADASHQLRTPLAALRLRLENLEGASSAGGGADLQAALAEVERLSRIVDGLLALARTDSTTAHPARIDVGSVVAERLDAWTALAEEQGVSLAGDIASGLSALATPGRLEQVLDNLLANALEVSPAGGTIAVSGAPAGAFAELHVADEGPGLSEEQRARAFDRFWRAGPSAGGSGLGLAIVERLVTADGGEVALHAARGGGLDACVRLPLPAPLVPAPARAPRRAG
ncbi:MAG: HAMP domain-containing protein [Thermoleophilia bacterium]|nr:HAMP domain-containing protein [Thermoleophilia bacterium]